ncbi:MAG: hypothetical protein O9301_14530 [Leptospira sp.]|nr:hypothetical protein [Leptospira sp.]
MEKIRIGVFLFFLLILAVLTFSLTKSMRFYEGYEVTVETTEPGEKEKQIESSDGLDLEDGNGKVYWKQYFVYPLGLVTEAGGIGPDGYISHARNIYFVNLKTGSVKKLFPRDIYVWDFFPGEFTKKITSNNIDEPKEEVLSIDKKMILIAVTEDSNGDGFLNQKDYRSVFVYDPEKESLEPVLPKNYHFRKLIFNTGKNTLALVIGKNLPLGTKNKSKPTNEDLAPEIFVLDLNTGKSIKTPVYE